MLRWSWVSLMWWGWVLGGEGRGGGVELTGRVGGFEDPVCVFGVGDCGVVPFDLEVARCFFEEGWAGKGVDVEFRFGGHGCLGGGGLHWLEVGDGEIRVCGFVQKL